MALHHAIISVNLLARRYDIDGLVAYSAQEAVALADVLREEDSAIFLRYVALIMEYEACNSDDPLRQLAMKQLRVVLKEEEAKHKEGRKVLSEWKGRRCETVFRYLRPEGRTSVLSLRECPSCASDINQDPGALEGPAVEREPE